MGSAERRFIKKVKFNFRKIASVLASTVMVSSSVAFAAAANLQNTFVPGGAADVAVLYGNSAVDSDRVAALDIASALGGYVTTTGTSGGLSISGESWQVGTSSDELEIGEPIDSAGETFIDSGNLPNMLADAEISNEKGTAKYSQFLYFDESEASVNFTEDDDDNVGLFYRISSGDVIARYVMDFTTNLESDVETDGTLSDIEDEQIEILGKTYTITSATNQSGGNLILLSGAVKGVATSQTQNFGGYDVSALVTSATQVRFTVNGVTTDRMNVGDLEKLPDGKFISVSDIDYQDFAGGIAQAEFFIGADKVELRNGATLKVNNEDIGDAAVTITSSQSGGDISITEISVNMTAEDDLFVPVGGKLSQAADLDEPEVLFTQGWDIVFNGLAPVEYEELKFRSTSGDSKYVMDFMNADGNKISLPVAFANSTGIFGGDKRGHELVLNPGSTGGIAKNQYFVINTRDPSDDATDAKTFVIQYKGSDAATDDSPKVRFNILGVDSGREIALDSDGTFDLKLGGTTFTFANTTVATSDDFAINLTSTANGYSSYSVSNGSTMLLRTKYNALINITDTVSNSTGIFPNSNWIVSVSADDTDRDGDYTALTNGQSIFSVVLSNDTTNEEITTGAVSSSLTLIDNPDNDDESLGITSYGADIKVTDTSDSPAQITVMIPESAVNPMVYLVSSSGVSGGSTGNIMTVRDSEASTVSSKNLIVVGGSCINTVAASLLGSASPLCGADFTSNTNVGAGQWLIQTFASPFSSSKVATLVAGYNAADTTNAAKALTTTEKDANFASGQKKIGTTVTASV